MRTRAWTFRLLVANALLFTAACEETTAFTRYECTSPAASAVRDTTDPTTAYTISDAEWDETAVRHVLHVFAFGGFATDAQIYEWADMAPGDAIREMITFETTNENLSPPAPDTPPIHPKNASLRCLSGLFSIQSKDNPIPGGDRSDYAVDEYDAVGRTWAMAARIRGLNPVRQRIGFWETNYHLALSTNSGVSNRQMMNFYDGVMNDLAAGHAYEEVLTNAALSAAVAQQYNHRENAYINGKFEGNEDFGREYHQLYFGILGTYDDAYTGPMADLHELVTIPSTARALTDMVVDQSSAASRETITYGTAEHWQGTLQILETPNMGSNARERFEALAPTTIAHPESLANLPVSMIRQLADDLLDAGSTDPAVMARVAAVRAIWAGFPTKNLLDFIRAYAISTAFHDPGRVKYWNSVERNLLVNNLTSLRNRDAYREIYDPRNYISSEDVNLFRPSHDVFGGQTGIEAATTANVFASAYNRSVAQYWSLTRTEEGSWRKDWSQAVARAGDGEFRVKETAEWLWQRYVADGLDHLGPLERAHLYALLASGRDLGYWIDSSASTTVYTLDQINNLPAVHNQVVGAEGAFVLLDSGDADEREEANYRVGLAVNFIVATPYFMAQQGR